MDRYLFSLFGSVTQLWNLEDGAHGLVVDLHTSLPYSASLQVDSTQGFLSFPQVTWEWRMNDRSTLFFMKLPTNPRNLFESWFTGSRNETCIVLIYLFYHLGSDLTCFLFLAFVGLNQILSLRCTIIKEFLEIILLHTNLKCRIYT